MPLVVLKAIFQVDLHLSSAEDFLTAWHDYAYNGNHIVFFITVLCHDHVALLMNA